MEWFSPLSHSHAASYRLFQQGYSNVAFQQTERDGGKEEKKPRQKVLTQVVSCVRAHVCITYKTPSMKYASAEHMPHRQCYKPCCAFLLFSVLLFEPFNVPLQMYTSIAKWAAVNARARFNRLAPHFRHDVKVPENIQWCVVCFSFFFCYSSSFIPNTKPKSTIRYARITQTAEIVVANDMMI